MPPVRKISGKLRSVKDRAQFCELVDVGIELYGKSMLYLETTSHDPAFNLALEESLLRSLPANHPGYFLLWQNIPSIIVGRHQCTAEVVNPAFVAACKIPVIRRMTGGGAVYHDLGNLNFSFIVHSRGKAGLAAFLAPIMAALAGLGVNASLSGRNDLEVNGKKISGSAQMFFDNKLLHHGTLLVNLDLERMADALRVDEAKFKSKGVASIRARVANLGELIGEKADMAQLKEALASSCASGREVLSPQMLAAAGELAERKYSTWDWNYGQSPPFNLEKRRRFPWGDVAIRLDVKKGRIRNCALNGDFFSSAPIADLEKLFANLPFEPGAVKSALANVCWPDYFSGCDAERMRAFLTDGIFG